MDSTLDLTPELLKEKEECITSAIYGGIDIAAWNHKGILPRGSDWKEEVSGLVWEHFKKEADGRKVSNRYFLHWAKMLTEGYLKCVNRPVKKNTKVEA